MASYNLISDHPSPSPQSHDEEELSDQSWEGFKEFEVGKNTQKAPHVKPQFQVNRTFNAQKPTVAPPKYSSDVGEEEKKNEEIGEEDDESENCPRSPSASFFTIEHNNSLAKPTFKHSQCTSNRPSANKKAKITADEPITDKPSSVSAATAGMVWSDEQVTKLLQHVIEFKVNKGVDADADPAAFHQFFEQEFQFRYSKSRVYEKVRRLKIKYFNKLKKFEKVGKDTGISKAELQALNPSRQISGGRAGAGDFESNYPLLSQSFEVDSRSVMKFGGKTADELSFLKEDMHSIGDDKAKELEQKW